MATRSLDSDGELFSNQTWISATFILVLTTLFSKALGVLRDVFVARYFGAGTQVDAFMVAVTIPGLVSWFGFALATAFIPVYRRAAAEGRLAYGPRLAGGVVAVTLVLSGLMIAVIVLLPRQLIRLVAPALPPDTTTVVMQLVRPLSLLVLGLNLFHVLGGIYNALEHFRIPAYTDLASNVVVLLALVALSTTMGIGALSLGTIGGSLLVVTAMTIPVLLRRAVIFSGLWSADLARLIVLATPVFLIEVLSYATTIVENSFGSRLGPGSIAALGFAKRLTVMIVSLLALNVARAVFPVLSRFVSERNRAGARALFAKLTYQYAIAFIPVSIALMYFRNDIIRLVFLRGAFDASAAAKTAAAFLYYSAGLPLATAVPIFVRGCYAFGDTKTPLIAGGVGFMVLIALNSLIVPLLGIAGIALSTSVSLIPGLVLMGASLARQFGGVDFGALGARVGLATACGIVALGPLLGLSALGASPSGIGGVLIEVILYFAAYFALGWFVMQGEVRSLWRVLQSRS